MNISDLFFRLLILVGLGCSNCMALADAPKDSGKPAAKCTAVAGICLEKTSGKQWTPIKAGDPLPSGKLFIGMPRVEFVSLTGAVEGRLLADIGKRGAFPILETGVILHDADGVDIDLTFDRGLLVLENIKKEGAAQVRLRIREEVWLLQLQTPGAKVGLEIFGRLPPGLPKVIDEATDNPTTDVLMLVLKGRVFLDAGKEGISMREPPGLARFHWDSHLRQHSFQKLDKLPDTVVQGLADQESKVFRDIVAGTSKLSKEALGPGLDALIQSESSLERHVGVTLAGAVDELPRVFGVLMNSKYADTRDQAVIVLRHWLGRQPGQMKSLEDALVAGHKVTPVQARNVLQLFLGFTAEERREPDTYEVLLHYLAHKNQAIRTLAHWHLARLVPAGKNIDFDAAGPEAARQQAVERWHALIPDGQLPPASPKQATQKAP